MTAQCVLILGFGTTGGLIQAVDRFWRPRLGANAKLLITVYDHDVKALIESNFPTGDLTLVGFSHGGWKAVEVARQLPGRFMRLVLLDPVPYPNPKPNYAGFDLPDNVTSAWCAWRGYADQKTLFSGPIRSGRCQFTNVKYNPKPNPDEAARHGQYVWEQASVDAARL